MIPTVQLSDSDEWSDTDSPEEVHITRYLNKGLLQGLLQAKACADVKSGIKRHPGCYHMRDKTHAVLETKMKGYDGKHWDVPVSNRYQRATRRLTAYAIQCEVAKEQLRQAKTENETKKRVMTLLHPINTEFWDRIEKGLEQERMLAQKKQNELETAKDDVLGQLVSKCNRKIIEEETEIERESQVGLLSILNNMKDFVNKSKSLDRMLCDIAESNRRKSIVQQDLAEAFGRLAEEEEDEKMEYRNAMMEMMDESLNSLQQMFQRDRTGRMSNEEQRRRTAEWNNLAFDKRFVKCRQEFDDVLGDMLAVFDMVENRETSQSSKTEQELSDRKEMMLQQLRRTCAQRKAEHMAAYEKRRRIKEEEKLLKTEDKGRENMLRLIARVQRQMILQKFSGRWVNLVEKSKKGQGRTEDGEVENDHDQKLRAIRMKQRRPSCVAKGLEIDD